MCISNKPVSLFCVPVDNSSFCVKSLQYNQVFKHCAHVVRGGKIFCKRIYNLYKELLHKGRKSIRIPSEARADIKWWYSFCRVFNGVAKINNALFEYPMVSDSSFKGYAVYMGSDWVAGVWDAADHFEVDTVCGHTVSKPPVEVEDVAPNINVFKLWPIVLGLKRWADVLSNKSVLVFIDNTQVLYMLSSGKSSNTTCMSWIREIFWVCSIHNIEIFPRYINTTCKLVADTLSRLPYFNSGRDIECNIAGADLCCLDILFNNYRSPVLKEKSRDYHRKSVADSTKKNREMQWRAYLTACRLYGWEEYPCSVEQACLYVTYLAERLSFASIATYYGAVVYIYACMCRVGSSEIQQPYS